jgi:pimeloyl-ACP methyl ester carboxylesterase
VTAAPALPRIEPVGRPVAEPSAVVLVLHGGQAHSTESAERKRLSYWRMVPFARTLARHRELAVYLVRYRLRGWNAPDRDALRDARWACEEVRRRHGDVPVVLLGHSMGGRAALAAAGGDAGVGVCALAPWLDESDPVGQLAGRAVLIVHGDRERFTDPGNSFAYALRAKRVTDRVARFDLPGAGHYMITRLGDWNRLVRDFVFGIAKITRLGSEIDNAMREPAPNGLRVLLT